MAPFYCEILRGVGFRDNNFKPLASNDPSTSTVGWGNIVGMSLTSDGNIMTITNGGPGNSCTHLVIPTPSSPYLSTTTYPYLVLRAKGTGTISFDLWAGASHLAGPFSTT